MDRALHLERGMAQMDLEHRPRARWDAPFWGAVLVVVVSIGSLGCFGLAAAIQANPPPDAEILTTDNSPPPPVL